MTRLEISQQYFHELGRCKHYEMKCNKYVEVDQEKYEKYLPKFLHHKKMAAKYYHKMKENELFMDFVDDESIFVDSSYFRESSASQSNK
jgi:hypothetical protein